MPSGTGFGEVAIAGKVASNGGGGFDVAALVGCALHGEDVVCWGDPDDARVREVAEPMSAP
jgi:hypothetical protein